MTENTPQKISPPENPSGRELDALITICTKVMGWHHWVNTHIDYDGPHPAFAVWDIHSEKYPTASVYEDEISGDVTFYFNPFERIADAWLVVEKLSSMDVGLLMNWYFYRQSNGSWILNKKQAPTAPLAICLAALKAVGDG